MISSLLSLRGSHLRAGLATLLKTADPSLEAYADAIVARVVTHPLLSDSAFSQQSPFKAKDCKHAKTFFREFRGTNRTADARI